MDLTPPPVLLPPVLLLLLQFRITGTTVGLNVPGTVTCLQAPCNVIFPERPWYNG